VLIGIVVGHVSAELAWIPYHPALVGLAGALLIRVVVFLKGLNAKKYRKDREYGSARWRAES